MLLGGEGSNNSQNPHLAVWGILTVVVQAMAIADAGQDNEEEADSAAQMNGPPYFPLLSFPPTPHTLLG